MKRFGNLAEVESYVEAREAASNASTMDEAADIMEQWQRDYYAA